MRPTGAQLLPLYELRFPSDSHGRWGPESSCFLKNSKNCGTRLWCSCRSFWSSVYSLHNYLLSYSSWNKRPAGDQVPTLRSYSDLLASDILQMLPERGYGPVTSVRRAAGSQKFCRRRQVLMIVGRLSAIYDTVGRLSAIYDTVGRLSTTCYIEDCLKVIGDLRHWCAYHDEDDDCLRTRNFKIVHSDEKDENEFSTRKDSERVMMSPKNT